MSLIKIKLKKALDLCLKNKLDQALIEYESIFKLNSNEKEALDNVALIYLKKKNYHKAELMLMRSLEVQWSEGTALNLFNLFLEMKKLDHAENIINRLISENPLELKYKLHLCQLKNFSGKYDEAIELYKKIHPANNQQKIAILIGMAFCMNKLNKLKDAIKLYDEALMIDPKNSDALYNQAIVRVYLNDELNEAIKGLLKYIHIYPRNINALLTLANAYEKSEQLDLACEQVETAMKIDPNHSMVHHQKGTFLEYKGMYSEAREYYENAIRLDSDSYLPKYNLAINNLRIGIYKEGVNLYRWRILSKGNFFKFDDLKIEKINLNKKIIIYFEQGIGDQLLFLRMIDYIDDKYLNNVTYVTQDKLYAILKRTYPQLKIIKHSEYLNERYCDDEYQKINLGSLMRLIEFKEFPPKVIYPLKNDHKYLKNYKNKYKCDKKIIGISWKSTGSELSKNKSLKLNELISLIDNIGEYVLINLQYGNVDKEIQEIRNKMGIEIKNEKELDYYENIDGINALIETCDLVLTTSNINAHLAGMANKKTILILPEKKGNIWYWGIKDKSDWYPEINKIYMNDKEIKIKINKLLRN